MIVARDVRHDAEGEDRQLQQRATREQVDEREEPLGGARLVQAGLHVREVDERSGDVRTESVDGDDAEREADLPTQIRSAEDPRDSAEQRDFLQWDAGRVGARRIPTYGNRGRRLPSGPWHVIT